MPFITQGKTNWKFLLIVIILVAIVGGGIWWFLQQQIPSYQPLEIKIPEKVKDETADWQTYKNEEYGFEIKYPLGYQVKDVTYSGILYPTETTPLKYAQFLPQKGYPIELSISNISQSDEWTFGVGGEGGSIEYEYNSSTGLWKISEELLFPIWADECLKDDVLVLNLTEKYHNLDEIISSLEEEIDGKIKGEDNIGFCKQYLPHMPFTTQDGFPVYGFDWWGMEGDGGSNYIIINQDKNVLLEFEYYFCDNDKVSNCEYNLTAEEEKKLFLEAIEIIKSVTFFK